jgi:hypothetical protein
LEEIESLVDMNNGYNTFPYKKTPLTFPYASVANAFRTPDYKQTSTKVGIGTDNIFVEVRGGHNQGKIRDSRPCRIPNFPFSIQNTP